jgi:hypothetical protein
MITLEERRYIAQRNAGARERRWKRAVGFAARRLLHTKVQTKSSALMSAGMPIIERGVENLLRGGKAEKQKRADC